MRNSRFIGRFIGRSVIRNLVAAATVSLALSACVMVPAGGGYYGGSVGYAPPAEQAEMVGVAPYPGYVWMGGYWNWAGGRYAWMPGRWSAPRAGYHWVAPHWEQRGRGWQMRRGGWRR